MMDHDKEKRTHFIEILEKYIDKLIVYLPHVENLMEEVARFSRKIEDKIISDSEDEESEY